MRLPSSRRHLRQKLLTSARGKLLIGTEVEGGHLVRSRDCQLPSGSSRACPHCGNAEAKLMPQVGDYSEYRCPDCDTYRVSGTMEALIEKGTVDPRAAHIDERDGHRWLVT